MATELAARGKHDGVTLTSWHTLPGVAFAVMAAVKRGKPIRSLGFIAERLARMTDDDDFSWAFGIPSTLSPEQHRHADAHAQRWVQQLEAGKFPWCAT